MIFVQDHRLGNYQITSPAHKAYTVAQSASWSWHTTSYARFHRQLRVGPNEANVPPRRVLRYRHSDMAPIAATMEREGRSDRSEDDLKDRTYWDRHPPVW